MRESRCLSTSVLPAILITVGMLYAPAAAAAQAPALSSCDSSKPSAAHLIAINLANDDLKWRILTVSKNRRVTSDGVERCLPPLIDTLAKAAETKDGVLAALNETDRFASRSEPRFYSEKADVVELFVFYYEAKSGVTPQIGYKETSRRSRLDTDLATLAELILSGALPFTKADNEMRILHKSYQLAESRGTLSVSATPPPAKDAPPAPTGLDAVAASIRAVAQSLAKADTQAKKADAKSDGPSSSASASILTGSGEHWFISANVNVRKFSELSFDKETKQIGLKEKAPTFLISANYFFGDLAASGSNNVFVGVAFEPSRRPASSIGPIIGVRLQGVKFLGLSLDTFSPYVGGIRVVNDEAADADRRVTWRAITGLSFNLDKVSGWVK